MPQQTDTATGEALPAARLATIANLKALVDQPKQYVGSAEGSMKWRRNLESLNKGKN